MKKTLTTAVALLALAVPAGAHAAQPAHVKTTCFSAQSWNANDADRPCVTVVAPDNDRVVVVQGTANRELAQCVVNYANVNDAVCRRIGANRAAPTPVAAPHHLSDSPQVVCTTLHLCATVGVPQEDGSGLVVVQAGNLRVSCTLSNPNEEVGTYTVPCHVVS